VAWTTSVEHPYDRARHLRRALPGVGATAPGAGHRRGLPTRRPSAQAATSGRDWLSGSTRWSTLTEPGRSIRWSGLPPGAGTRSQRRSLPAC